MRKSSNASFSVVSLIASSTVDRSYSFRHTKEGSIPIVVFSSAAATKALVAAINMGCQSSIRYSSLSGGTGILSGTAIADIVCYYVTSL